MAVSTCTDGRRQRKAQPMPESKAKRAAPGTAGGSVYRTRPTAALPAALNKGLPDYQAQYCLILGPRLRGGTSSAAYTERHSVRGEQGSQRSARQPTPSPLRGEGRGEGLFQAQHCLAGAPPTPPPPGGGGPRAAHPTPPPGGGVGGGGALFQAQHCLATPHPTLSPEGRGLPRLNRRPSPNHPSLARSISAPTALSFSSRRSYPRSR